LLNDEEQIDAKAIREDESQVSWRDVLGTGFFGQYVGIIRVHEYMYCTIEYIPNVYNSTHSYMNSMMTLDSMYMGVGLEALFSWYSFAIYIYIAKHIISTFVQISINIQSYLLSRWCLFYCGTAHVPMSG